MTATVQVRAAVPADLPLIERLLSEAFPDEDLVPLVRALHADANAGTAFVAVTDGGLAGYLFMTVCSIDSGSDTVAMLGPLGVVPKWQQCGIGGALVGAGVDWARQAGMTKVLVLGDPAYYGRLGFTPEALIATPYPLPAEWRHAWQSIGLATAASSGEATLMVPEPWREPALWGP